MISRKTKKSSRGRMQARRGNRHAVAARTARYQEELRVSQVTMYQAIRAAMTAAAKGAENE
jgi:hypothetical protein